jgi:putative holliday junction resolvase
MPRLSPTRFLALDVGDRRIGVATASSETGLATPLETLDRAQGDEPVLRRLKEIVRTEGAATVVVGDPLNMDGTAGPQAVAAREFACLLKKALRQIEVVMLDERLSSFAADEWMERAGIKPDDRKKHRDAYAAAVILLDYLDARKADG